MEFIDLKAQYRTYKDEIDEGIAGVLSRASFIGGDHVERLERDLARYVGRSHCITCANGTEALQLIYMAYGIGAGDAVFCPDMTFIASVEPAAMLGATPVFCDIDPISYNIAPDALEERIDDVKQEGRLVPKAVVAVDFLGNPADYDRLGDICDRHGLVLIEDAAQGMGGQYKGRKLGAFGHAAATSFFPSKPLGCYGDGGAVFVDDDGIAEIMRSLKVHGKGSSKYDNVRIGVNSRLDNLQAAIVQVKLSQLDEEIAIRQKVAAHYHEALCGIIATPVIAEGSISAYAQYILLAQDSQQRSTIMASMEEAGIPSLIYYPKPLHEMRAFEKSNAESYSVAEGYANRNFGLPFSAFLTDVDQACVIEAVREALSR